MKLSKVRITKKDGKPGYLFYSTELGGGSWTTAFRTKHPTKWVLLRTSDKACKELSKDVLLLMRGKPFMPDLKFLGTDSEDRRYYHTPFYHELDGEAYKIYRKFDETVAPWFARPTTNLDKCVAAVNRNTDLPWRLRSVWEELIAAAFAHPNCRSVQVDVKLDNVGMTNSGRLILRDPIAIYAKDE